MINKVREVIDRSKHVVVLSGLKASNETGLEGLRQENRAYDIEMKYGFSPEELVTATSFMRRAELFYRFYKEEVLEMEKMIPTETHRAMARLEKRGILGMIVTRDIYGLYQMEGVTNIIELHGNVMDNKCQKCGKLYPARYIKEAKGLPLCSSCKIVLRPGFALFGETIDNGKISKAAENVLKADTIMVIGASLEGYLSKYMLQYYEGNQLILINDEKDVSDSNANYVLYGKCKDILPQIIP